MPAGTPGSRPSASGRSPRPASVPLPCTAPPGIRAATSPFSAAGIRCIVSFRIRGSFSVPHHHGRLVPVVRVQLFAQPRLPALPRGLRDRFHAYRFAHTFLLSPALFRAKAAVPFRCPARSRGNKKEEMFRVPCTRKKAGFSDVSARFSVPAFPRDIRQITARPKLPSNAPAIRRVVFAHLFASAIVHSRAAVAIRIFPRHFKLRVIRFAFCDCFSPPAHRAHKRASPIPFA